MRRYLETDEISEAVPLLNAPPAVSAEVRVRALHSVEAAPTHLTPSSLVAVADATHALEAGGAVETQARELARREKIRQRGRAIETALNGDGGPSQQFANLFETFAVALASGITEDVALRLATRDAPDALKATFGDVAAQIEQGVPLVQALRKHEEELPDLVVPIFEQGLLYGTAETASRQLAHALKRLARVEEKFEYSALNPGMMIPLVVGGFLLLGLPPIFFLFGHPLVPYLLLCAACLGGSALSWRFRHKLMQRRIRLALTSRLALKGGGNGFVRRQLGAARWSRTFAALWHCGVPISSALEAAGRSTRNSYYERILRQAAQETRGGKSLSESLAHVGLLRGEMIETIRTAEITGELGLALEKWADVLEDDAKQRGGIVLFIKTLGLLLLIALIVCIACLLLSWILVGAQTATFK